MNFGSGPNNRKLLNINARAVNPLALNKRIAPQPLLGHRQTIQPVPRPVPTKPPVKPATPNPFAKLLSRVQPAQTMPRIQPPLQRPNLLQKKTVNPLLQPNRAVKVSPPVPPKPARIQPPMVSRPKPVQPNIQKDARPLVYTRPLFPQPAQRKPAVVQQVKFYPNLHPGAAMPVDRDTVFRLDYFADQYRLHKLNNRGAYVPNLKYNFVRTQGGDMLLHNRYRHPSLAEGKQVLYAGEVSFNNGSLNWWSNGSGHYQPDEDSAKQAGLPMDQFYSYQQVLKGEHERNKNK